MGSQKYVMQGYRVGSQRIGWGHRSTSCRDIGWGHRMQGKGGVHYVSKDLPLVIISNSWW